MAVTKKNMDDTETPNSAEPAVAKQFKIKGLKPLEDGRIPIVHGGQKFDLAQTSQQELQWLYENGCPFVTAN